jgi:hypothetical protein
LQPSLYPGCAVPESRRITPLQYFTNGQVAAVSCFFLDAGSIGPLDFQLTAGEADVSLLAEILAMMLPGIRAGVQTVVEMYGMDWSL